MECYAHKFKRYENIPNEYLTITVKMQEEWNDYPLSRIVTLDNVGFKGVVIQRAPKNDYAGEIKMRNIICFERDEFLDKIDSCKRNLEGLDKEIKEWKQDIIDAEKEKIEVQEKLSILLEEADKWEYT
jgi:hypothetical protein